MNAVLMAIFLVPAILSGQEAEDDKILKRFAAAEQSFAEETEKLKRAVLKSLDAAEQAARRGGDKDVVERLKDEREVFEKNGAYPSTPSDAAMKRFATAREAMEKAYESAIRDCTKASRDYEAKDFERRLAMFQASQRLFDEEMVRRVLVGSWDIVVPDQYKGRWTFNRDGTVTESANQSGRYVIELEKKRILIAWKNGAFDRFDLPLTHKNPTGSQGGERSTKLNIVRVR